MCIYDDPNVKFNHHFEKKFIIRVLIVKWGEGVKEGAVCFIFIHGIFSSDNLNPNSGVFLAVPRKLMFYK